MALVITIIILLILAGVIIGQLTRSGLLEKTSQATIQYKKAQYMEEIKIEIANEQIERYSELKNEAFIVSLKYRLEGQNTSSIVSKTATYSRKEWVSSTIMCDENGNENENLFENNILIVTTIDGYDIYIDVDNNANNATIREDTFVKSSTSVITYNSNTGSGTMNSQSVKTGLKVTLSENGFSKTGFVFVGWCKNSDGSGEKYSELSKVTITKDTTFYAIWSQTAYTITYDANGGSGTIMNDSNVNAGDSIQLSANTYTIANYTFVNWNTKADGSGDVYENNSIITPIADITLFAQWEETIYILSYNQNNGSGTLQTQSGKVGTKLILMENPYTRTNYTFEGWGISSTSSNSNEIYQPGDEIILTKDVVLYAIWNLQVETGVTVRYRGYNFIIYGEEDGKYLARPSTDCGTYKDYTPSTSLAEYLTNTFGISGKIEADVFHFSSNDIAVVRSCGITNGNIWMLYNNKIQPISSSFTGVTSSNQKVDAYLVPKLTIDPSAIITEYNKTYATIQGDDT